MEKPYLTYKQVVEQLSDKATEYHDVNIRKTIFNKFYSILILLVLVVIRVPNIIRDFSPFGKEYSFMAVIFVLVLFQTLIYLLELPLSIYAERVERRFEFSTRTNRKFIIDEIKSYLLQIIILAVVTEAIFAAFEFVPDYWWVYGFLGSFVFMALIQFISPLLISWFTKIEPLEAGEVRSTVEELAKDMELDYQDIYLWKMSEQTSKANAAVVGFGKSIKIILGDTLIDNFRVDEVKIVMAHEIGHQKNKDVYRGTVYFGFFFLVIFYLIDLTFDQAMIWFDLSSKSDPAALGFFMLGIGVFSELLQIFQLALIRRQEKAADVTAIRQVKNLELYESAFARLSQQNLSYPNPSRLEVLFLYSHPPIRDRVAYAKNYV